MVTKTRFRGYGIMSMLAGHEIIVTLLTIITQ